MPFIGAQKRSNEASAEKRCLDWRNTFGRLVGNWLIAHLDDLCVYHWLFVLINSNTGGRRHGYRNVLEVNASSRFKIFCCPQPSVDFCLGKIDFHLQS